MIVLIVFYFFGGLLVVILGKICLKVEWIECFDCCGIFFLKLKLILMFFFGICYFFYCGLYIWKYSLEYENKEFGIICYVVIVFNVVCLFIYFEVCY